MRNTVENLVLKHHTRNPYTISSQLGIIVLEENLGTINGYYNEVMGVKFIHVNNNLPEYKRKFICAHELGHAILHPNFNQFFLKTYTHFIIDKYENEANSFAIHLTCDESVKKRYTINELSSYYHMNNIEF